jgi:hypothetical protein
LERAVAKSEILTQTTFGHRIAEDEAEQLGAYFVETEQWRKVISGQVDVVYGPKGSGKSALYALLRKNQEKLHERGVILAPGENIRGTPVFEALVADPPAGEEQFRGLWKIYFLSLIGTAFRSAGFQGEIAKDLDDLLEDAGLIHPQFSLKHCLRSALDYVRRIEGLSGGVKLDPITSQASGVEAKITLREPGTDERKRGFVSADSLLAMADQSLQDIGLKFWIVLDRLDVAFSDSSELEKNALRALFRVYRDMAALDNMKLKIFLRDDIWLRITSEGFREASHITQSITITWDQKSLLNLIVRRLLHNAAIRDFYGIDPNLVLASSTQQEALFYRAFPPQVDAGERKSTTLDWILTRTQDGTLKTAPREVIHLLSEARDIQLKLIEMGTPEPPGETLFERAAFKAALPEVSKVRYQQTLCAENPRLKPFLTALDNEKTQQTATTLAKIWRVSEVEALSTAERLTEIGFFQKRGSKDQPMFWVPFLYRDALHLVQGQAD